MWSPSAMIGGGGPIGYTFHHVTDDTSDGTTYDFTSESSDGGWTLIVVQGEDHTTGGVVTTITSVIRDPAGDNETLTKLFDDSAVWSTNSNLQQGFFLLQGALVSETVRVTFSASVNRCRIAVISLTNVTNAATAEDTSSNKITTTTYSAVFGMTTAEGSIAFVAANDQTTASWTGAGPTGIVELYDSTLEGGSGFALYVVPEYDDTNFTITRSLNIWHAQISGCCIR